MEASIETTAASSPSNDVIVDAAADLLAVGGPASLSVRRVAEKLGVSRQIVYTRFGAKSGLIRAMHDEGFRRLSARVDQIPSGLDPAERLRRIGLAYREAALAGPELFEVMFGHPIPEFEPDAGSIEIARSAFEPIAEAAGEWMDAHLEKCADPSPTELAGMCWSATHGIVALELAGHTYGDPEAAITESISTLLAGVEAGRQLPR